MIRPAHLIRRTAVIVANLTPDPILGLTAKAVCWLRRDAYFAGAQAAIRGDDLPFNVVDLAPADQERQAHVVVSMAEIRAEFEALEQAIADDWTYVEPARTYTELRRYYDRLDATMADWAREVEACADRELAEMVEGEA